MNVIIVDDEQGAADSLRLLLEESFPRLNVVAVLASIEETIAWHNTNLPPEIAFFDIQLSDGLSLELFSRINITYPVIFTTAFDRYAVDAFKVNSIAYLLKPVTGRDIHASLEKYEFLQMNMMHTEKAKTMLTMMSRGRYSNSFLVHYRNKLIPVTSADVAFIFTRHGLVQFCTQDNHHYPADKSLEELEGMLDPDQFFRANRQFIINRKYITEVEFYYNGRLLVNLRPRSNDKILISKARVPAFRKWLKT